MSFLPLFALTQVFIVVAALSGESEIVSHEEERSNKIIIVDSGTN